MQRHNKATSQSGFNLMRQRETFQHNRQLIFWCVVAILALTTIACGFLGTGTESRANHVVILTRLPTLTSTPPPNLMPIPNTNPTTTAIAEEFVVAPAADNEATPVTAESTPNSLPTLTATPIAVVSAGDGSNAAEIVVTGPPSALKPGIMPQNNTAEEPEPTSVPIIIPTATPKPEAPNNWQFANIQLYPDQYEGGLLLYGDMINNSGSAQDVSEITGTFYDAQGQVIASADNTEAYWSVETISHGGRTPFEMVVEGIENAANFNLSVEAEPSQASPRQDFAFLDLNQWAEEETYCLTGQLQNLGDQLEEYLIIGVTLYDGQDNIINFGDYIEPDVDAITGNETLEFEICIDPPNQNSARHEMWAWGR
jgi:hypothetical protein